ncbi:hypothetical protein SLEP1_g55928 [Rubroshorea leprosula]|uniref:Uncharacterized protein n=1 Tax=Rubroshorea leprosula TaxID=152421 RepID=A0AAV5MGW4_9ROSI|nr:hypothetical protein SLEP1_g55928 [Rubroshorea leprosula]
MFTVTIGDDVAISAFSLLASPLTFLKDPHGNGKNSLCH